MTVEYTAAVGTKFFADGSVRAFPGNSIVSEVKKETKQHPLLKTIQDELMSASFGSAFTCLPPSSYHMTIFDLVCDQVRQKENWSSLIPLDLPLPEVDKKLEELVAPLEKPTPLNMVFDHFELEKTIGTILVPADEATKAALSSYREKVSSATGIRHPNHETYFFHISLAYILRKLSANEERALKEWVITVDHRLEKNFGTLELPPPELVFFPHMHSFPTERR